MNVKMKSQMLLGNPFLYYSVTFLIAIVLSELHWTALYPEASLITVNFFLISSFLCIVLAYVFRKRCIYLDVISPLRFYSKIKKYIYLTFMLLAIECLYHRTIPILGYFTGSVDAGLYKEFGIPFLHVIVVNSIMFLFYISSYCYFSIGGGKNKYLKITILLLFSPLLFMNRAMVMYMIFALFLLYMMSRKSFIKSLVTIILSGLLIMYLFGLTGNMRNGDYTGDYIMSVGGATDEFKESFIPKEFFWTYVYLSTPLGNLQNAINEKKKFKEDETGPGHVFVSDILPQFISKRLGVKSDDVSRYLVVEHLTVGTTYIDAYVHWGWAGMWMVFAALVIYTSFMLLKIPIGSLVHVPLLCVLSTMFFFSSFANMIVYMGLFPQLVFIYLLRHVK